MAPNELVTLFASMYKIGMDSIMRGLLIVPICLALQACSHFTTYQADMGTPTTGVSMDAKQRVVLVNYVPTPPAAAVVGTPTGQRRMCAEPSPDALSALGATFGASVLSPSGTSQQLAAALGESTGSIGLRTTSIQLMRDAMYRACEAYLSGGIKESDYQDLQAHSQTLIVGLLAIEQLTGAVQAQQLALTSNVAGGSGGDGKQEADALIEQKKLTLEQQQKADAANKDKKSADDAVTAKQAEIAKADQDPKATDDQKTQLKKDLSDLQGKATAATTEADKQAGLLKIQQQAEAIALQAFQFANSRIKTSVSGDAKFSQQTRGGMSDATAATIATAITTIVHDVSGLGVERKKCINLLADPNLHLEPERMTALIAQCDAVGKVEDQKQQNLTNQLNLLNQRLQFK